MKNNPLIISIVIWTLGIGSWTAYELCKNVVIVKPLSYAKKFTPTCVEDTFTVRDFVLELHIQKVQYPDVVLRQACLESNFFRSLLWRTKNNPFGFVGKDGYIMFNDWKSAIAYMHDWQDKHYKGEENYYHFLDRIKYAEDSNYIRTLKSMDLNNLKSMK